jgi:hypothetical protein
MHPTSLVFAVEETSSSYPLYLSSFAVPVNTDTFLTISISCSIYLPVYLSVNHICPGILFSPICTYMSILGYKPEMVCLCVPLHCYVAYTLRKLHALYQLLLHRQRCSRLLQVAWKTSVDGRGLMVCPTCRSSCRRYAAVRQWGPQALKVVKYNGFTVRCDQ